MPNANNATLVTKRGDVRALELKTLSLGNTTTFPCSALVTYTEYTLGLAC